MKFFNAFTHSIVAGSLLVACQVVASPLDETVTTIASINETLSKIEQRPNRADDELTLEVKNGQLYLSSHNKRINENTWSFEVYRLGIPAAAVPLFGLSSQSPAPTFEKKVVTTVGDLRKSLSSIETQNVEIFGEDGKLKLKSTIKIPAGDKWDKPIVHIGALLSLLNELGLADDQVIHLNANDNLTYDDVFVFALPRENGAAATVYGMNYYRSAKDN